MTGIKTNKNASEASDQDRADGDSCVFSLRATWHDLGGPSPIQQPQLNHNDSHLCISSQPLIDD